ncbi:hypothetical protein Tsubulata_029915 [Turnera subulata]|uniref:EXPERA domain-containing protein n=1 Tax=Turnera subulata TaxID=218843 RepID=A0A9Q0JEA9_9ROSI|nr:hypothetical protein Tsubulata_029915 [Turnera subulata]
MVSFVQIMDTQLFFIFLFIAIVAPLIDGQTVLPSTYYPDKLVNLKQWYAQDFGDYLVVEKPHFFVGLVWYELIFLWPLSLLNLFAILTSKPWLNNTCLIYGASTLSSMAAILAELVFSGRGNDRLLKMYAPFAFFGAVALIRGLIPGCGKNGGAASVIGKRPTLGRKKRV